MRPALSVALLLLVCPAGLGATGVVDTVHNLSVTGPGEVKSASETEVCVFCHGAHTTNNAPTLWNRQTSSQVAYQPYESATMSARAGQPDGSSRMCLSCHDGTLAVGDTEGGRARANMMGTSPMGRLRARSPSNLGTDLSGSHPVSISYQAATRSVGARSTRLKSVPLAVEGPLLDARGEVQCTSCHDPHSDPAASGARVPPFWRGATFSQVCTSCHDAPMADAGHDNPGTLVDSCGSCHVGHGVKGQPLLARAEEQACYECHGAPSEVAASVAAGRLAPGAAPVRVDDLFGLPYRHPVDSSSGLHRVDEGVSDPTARRHVECGDCHAAHGTPRVDAARRGTGRATGYDAETVTTCYRCHGPGVLPIGETDKSREFGAGARSAHPVDPSGPRPGVTRSLLPPWLSRDAMSCSDCHGESWDDGRSGVHGSRYPAILRAQYVVSDGAAEGEDTYALCYHCHDRKAILSNDSFRGHSRHVVEAKISCYSCHDSHGSAEYPGLIRFAKDFRYGAARAATSGRLEYDAVKGTCYVNCHGVDHDPLGYR